MSPCFKKLLKTSFEKKDSGSEVFKNYSNTIELASKPKFFLKLFGKKINHGMWNDNEVGFQFVVIAVSFQRSHDTPIHCSGNNYYSHPWAEWKPVNQNATTTLRTCILIYLNSQNWMKFSDSCLYDSKTPFFSHQLFLRLPLASYQHEPAGSECFPPIGFNLPTPITGLTMHVLRCMWWLLLVTKGHMTPPYNAMQCSQLLLTPSAKLKGCKATQYYQAMLCALVIKPGTFHDYYSLGSDMN